VDAQKYTSPLDADLALRVSRLDANQREFFEERSAIREFDGGQPRLAAELSAWDDTVRYFKLSAVTSTSGVIGSPLRRKDRT
jgi:hypothetical protein